MEDQAVTNFREYLRIKTVQPDPDYDGAVKFLIKMAQELELPYKVVEIQKSPWKPVFLMTWEGTDPSLTSILLNSHIDVVPVFLEHWKYDPFEAVKEENGDIFARGSQDMKCVGIQYIEAIRRLKQDDRRFSRTIHFSFVPDEEIGGHLGMAKFVHMKEFKDLNVGFALDEGLANPTDAFTLFYAERSPWWVKVSCPGKPGHGSRFLEDTAANKLRKVINSFMTFRDEQEKKLKEDSSLHLGDVTTVNLTILKGGVQFNVVPTDFTACFDIRITPTTDLTEFEKMIAKWCKEAGDDVTYEFDQKFVGKNLTDTSDANPWWKAFSKICGKLDMVLEKEIFPAATDSRYLRAVGYPALGFSPMNNTPILLHDHNEFLNETIFLRGIEIYCDIIPALASVPPL